MRDTLMEWVGIFAGISLIGVSVFLLVYGALSGRDLREMVPEWLVNQIGAIITFFFLRRNGKGSNGDSS